MTSGLVVKGCMSNDIICDFCSAPKAPWVFDAESFVAFKFEEFDLGSEGGWAACDTCKDFVRSQDIEGLVEHSMRSMVYEHPFVETLPSHVQDEVKASLENVIRDFFKHRKV